MIAQCHNCKKEFKIWAAKVRENNYCNRECLNEYRRSFYKSGNTDVYDNDVKIVTKRFANKAQLKRLLTEYGIIYKGCVVTVRFDEEE